MNLLMLLFVIIFFNGVYSLNPRLSFKEKNSSSKFNKDIYANIKEIENKNFFSPRMDYDEWTPLGRGDPLKNDPTYDYVPPVLERVHYWMDPSKRTPDPPSPYSGVLVLGSQTESSFTPRVTTPKYYLYQAKEAESRLDTGSLLDPFFNLMDMSNFGMNINTNNYYKIPPKRVQQRPQIQNNYKNSPLNMKNTPQALQRPPYTMLMPPPPVSSAQEMVTLKNIWTTPTSVKLEVSQLTTVSPVSTSDQSMINVTTERPLLVNTNNMFKPVAITMPENIEGTENELPNEITVKVFPTKPTTTEHSTIVLPIVKLFKEQNEIKEKLPKGESATLQQSELSEPFPKHPNILHQNKQKSKAPVKEVTTSPQKTSSFKGNLLAKTILSSETENNLQVTTSNPITTTHSLTYKIPPLTTDPMFKHYKQPSQPIRGPFYLIIQGHSKVKTYGASKNPINRLLTSNEIKLDEDDNRRRKYEKKNRKLRLNVFGSEAKEEKIENLQDIQSDNLKNIALTQEENLENLEETFGKTAGGNSKKRYLNSDFKIKRSARDTFTVSRRLLEIKSDSSITEKPFSDVLDKNDNLDLESLIAINDDYDPSDVVNILLKQDENPGSGFGDLAESIFGRSQKKDEKIL